MPQFSLDDFDKHIANLRAQLLFLNQALESTDHTAPDWVATDIVSLRNKSGRLQDDMQRFKDQLEREGLATRKSSNKRLSLEGAKPKSAPNEPNTTSAAPTHTLNTQAAPSSPAPSNSTIHPLSSPPPPSTDDYTPQHIDVSEEVHRRLHESRLRRLMGSPSTSQKRKFDVFENARIGNAEGEGEDEETDEGMETSPFKRVKASGSFRGLVSASIDSVLKRKEGGGSASGGGGRAESKRRRVVR